MMGRMSDVSGTLPVFFDGRVGPSTLWWKESHAFAARGVEDGEQEAEEAELTRAAQAALEIAQVSGAGEVQYQVWNFSHEKQSESGLFFLVSSVKERETSVRAFTDVT